MTKFTATVQLVGYNPNRVRVSLDRQNGKSKKIPVLRFLVSDELGAFSATQAVTRSLEDAVAASIVTLLREGA